jgi:lipopolysaccharide biosynthesis protein
LADEIRRHLDNIPVPYDLFVSTDTPEKSAGIADGFGHWRGGKLDIRIVPNRGRDIAPKLIAFRDVYDDHDLVLHIHSKSSEHTDFLKGWRSYLLASLIGSREIVRSALTIFALRPDIGVVAHQHFFPQIRHWIDWGGNFGAAERLASRMGIRLESGGDMDFPSGSMFWARSAAFKPILDLALGYDDFEPELGQTDRTLAHAIERLYLFVCERAGYRWLKTADPRLFDSADAIVPLASPAELDRFITENVVTLLRARAL